MYEDGEDLPLHVDFFMTEEQREEDIEKLSRSEKAMYDKRELCAEFCDKFLEHIAIMRKDLLSLDSNEDALDLHEEMKGITDVMKLFRVGLDQSVMNQPTQINLADWANLCLFRLAIVRRRVNALKIYIDKTGSAEALFKIEAFLYCIFEYLNTGEIDEYEMEAIEEEEFFDVRFLLDESTIHDPLAPKPEPRAKPPPPEEDPRPTEEDEEEEEEEDEPDKTAEPSSETPAVNLEPSTEESTPGETTTAPEASEEHPPTAEEISEVEVSESTPFTSTGEESGGQTTPKRPSQAQLRVAERRERRARLTKTSGFRANPLTASASGAELLSFYQAQNEQTNNSKKKKKTGADSTGQGEDSPGEEDSTKAPVGAVRSRLSLFDRMSRSPKTSRRKKTGGSIRHSTAMIVRRHRPEQPSMSLPLLRGGVQVLTSTNFSAQWKRRWLVLNNEQLEIYKEDTCVGLLKCYPVSEMNAIHLNGEEELAHEEKSSKKRKAVMEKEFGLLVDFAGDHLHLAPGSRKEQLQWIVALRAIQATTAPPDQALATNLTLIRELYVDHYPARVTFQQGDETWTLADGTLTSTDIPDVTASFTWDGLTCVSQGEASGFSLTWDGLTLTFVVPAQAPLLFRWVDCRKEFTPLQDTEDETRYAPWVWRPDQLSLHTGEAPEGKSTVSQTWTLTEPAAPPLALAVACLSNALSGRPLVYESYTRLLSEEAAPPVGERAELRKKKKDKKKKDKKKKDKEVASPTASGPASPEREESPGPAPATPLASTEPVLPSSEGEVVVQSQEKEEKPTDAEEKADADVPEDSPSSDPPAPEPSCNEHDEADDTPTTPQETGDDDKEEAEEEKEEEEGKDLEGSE